MRRSYNNETNDAPSPQSMLPALPNMNTHEVMSFKEIQGVNVLEGHRAHSAGPSLPLPLLLLCYDQGFDLHVYEKLLKFNNTSSLNPYP